MKDKYEAKTEVGKKLSYQYLYNILSTDREDSINVSFIDFNYRPTDDQFIDLSNKGQIYSIPSPEIVTKEIILKKVPIEIKNDISISEHLNKEFIKLIEIEGNKNKEIGPKYTDNGESKFDINYKKLYEEHNGDITLVEKHIMTKFNNLSNYIATDGRIGPGQFIISSKNTNKYLLLLFEKNNPNNKFKFIVDKQLDDETIIMGRKNEFSQPGILLILNESSLINIKYNEKKIPYVDLIYSFALLGFTPFHQFFTIKLKK